MWQRRRRAIAARAGRAAGFLGIDFDRDAAAERRAVLAARLSCSGVETLDARGQEIDVPVAQIHHWRGDVLIRRHAGGRRRRRAWRRLRCRRRPRTCGAPRVLDRGPGWIRVGLTLQRKKIVTVVYATEHLVTFETIAPGAR